MKNTFKLSLVALALVAGSAAQAQSAGTWMARVGAIGLYPQVSPAATCRHPPFRTPRPMSAATGAWAAASPT